MSRRFSRKKARKFLCFLFFVFWTCGAFCLFSIRKFTPTVHHQSRRTPHPSHLIWLHFQLHCTIRGVDLALLHILPFPFPHANFRILRYFLYPCRMKNIQQRHFFPWQLQSHPQWSISPLRCNSPFPSTWPRPKSLSKLWLIAYPIFRVI